jgi:ATP-dependent protease ClpP protease subunit
MLHFGSTTLTGDSLAIISAMHNEKRINDRMLDIYTKRCIKGEFFRKQYKSLNEGKVKSFLTRKLKDKSDWYLSAEESVYYGFADGLIGSKKYKNIKEIRDSQSQ